MRTLTALLTHQSIYRATLLTMLVSVKNGVARGQKTEDGGQLFNFGFRIANLGCEM